MTAPHSLSSPLSLLPLIFAQFKRSLFFLFALASCLSLARFACPSSAALLPSALASAFPVFLSPAALRTPRARCLSVVLLAVPTRTHVTFNWARRFVDVRQTTASEEHAQACRRVRSRARAQEGKGELRSNRVRVLCRLYEGECDAFEQRKKASAQATL